jgi:DNA-binding CsgD family transcriptional regulator
VTIDPAGFAIAVESLSSAVALGGSWRPSLEQMCSAVGAKTAALSRTSRTQLHIVATQALDEPIADMRSGRTPTYTSDVVLSSMLEEGFVSDRESRVRERLCRTPFYRDYMLPILDIPHRGSAALEGVVSTSALRISFWRGVNQGVFEPGELSQLNAFLPALRIAARFSQHLLQQKAQERSLFYKSRGDFVFHLDFLGRPLDEDHDAIRARGGPLQLLRGRLAASSAAEQQQLDAVIRRALPGRRKHGAVSLTRPSDGRRFYLLAMPVLGEASDVFGPISVLCTLIDPSREASQNPVAMQNLVMATGLTPREAEIAGQISAGLSPADIARRLGLREGTVRTHLKAAMQKCSVHSQIELLALIGRFA